MRHALQLSIRTLSLILALGMVLQSQYKLVIWLGFTARQDYISEILCVNRAKPLACCKGKCVLKERLATENARANAPLTIDGEREWLYVPPVSLSETVPAPPPAIAYLPPSNDWPRLSQLVFGILRPPIAA